MTFGWETFTNPPPAWDQLAQQEWDAGGLWVLLALSSLLIGLVYVLVCWLYTRRYGGCMSHLDRWITRLGLFCLGALLGSLYLRQEVWNLTQLNETRFTAMWGRISELQSQVEPFVGELDGFRGHLGALDETLRPGWSLQFDPLESTWGWVPTRAPLRLPE